MSETNVETNCLDIIEQLRYDRDKYIGMWRSQCTIAEEIMKERDRLTSELAEVREEYGHTCAKCVSVLQLVRPGKHQCQYCEMENALTAELSRYKQGVEVEVTVDSYDYGDTSFICEDIKLPSEFRGQRVRVLVMKVEEET